MLLRRSTAFNTAIGIFASILVFSMTTIAFKDILFTFALAVMTFFMYSHITFRYKAKTARFPETDLLIVTMFVLSVSSILFVSSIDKVFVMTWQELGTASLFSWTRLVSAILLLYFFPGYFILKVIGIVKENKKLDTLLFSFNISIFLTSLIALVVIRFDSISTFPGLSLNSQHLILAFLGVNSVLFLMFCLSKLRRRAVYDACNHKDMNKKVIEINIFEELTLLSVIAFVAAFLVILYNRYYLMCTDMWDMHGIMTSVLVGSAQYMGKGSGLTAYFPWYVVNPLSLYIMSGLPSANASNFLNFVSIVYVIGVYRMFKTYLDKRSKAIPVVATLMFVTFSGFGWLYTVNLGPTNDWMSAFHQTMNKTYFEIISANLPLYPSAGILGLLFMIMLLQLMVKKKSPRTDYIVTSLVTASLYLVHLAEIFPFLVFLLCYVIVSANEDEKRLKRFSLSVVLGLLITWIISRLLLLQSFPFTYIDFEIEIPFWTFFVLALSCYSVTFIGQRLHARIRINREVRFFIIIILWYVYALSFIVWGLTEPYINSWVILYEGMAIVPWYFYPFKWGVAGLLALICATLLLFGKIKCSKNMKFFLFSLIALLISGKFLSFVNLHLFWTGGGEQRFLLPLFIPISALAASLIVKLRPKVSFSQINHAVSRHFVFSVFLFLIMLGGVSTTILYASYWTQTEDYRLETSEEEINALNHLGSLPSVANSTILALSPESASRINTFTGLRVIESVKGVSIQNLKSIELLYEILSSYNIRYIYAASSELEKIRETDAVLYSLMPNLPIVYQNSMITIYNLPPFTPPKPFSDLLLMNPIEAFEKDKINPLTLIRADSTEGWRDPGYGNPVSISVDTFDLIEGSGSIKIDSITETTEGKLYARYTPEYSWNLTGKDFLILWLKIDKEIPVYITLIDSTQKIVQWGEEPKRDVWTKCVLRLENPDVGNPLQFGFDRIEYITIGTSFGAKNSPVTIYVDDVYADIVPGEIEAIVANFYRVVDMLAFTRLEYSIGTIFDYANFNSSYIILPIDLSVEEYTKPLIEKVENGQKLIVLNIKAGGNFASLMSLASNGSVIADGINGRVVFVENVSVPSTYSEDVDVDVIANYTRGGFPVSAYALLKKVGKGELIYVNIAPYFKALKNASDDGRRFLFSHLGVLIKALNVNFPSMSELPEPLRWQYAHPSWIRINDDDSIFETNINLTGSIKIYTNSFSITDLFPMTVAGIEHSPSEQIDTKLADLHNFHEVFIHEIQADGPLRSIITMPEIMITPTVGGSYSTLFPHHMFNWTINLSNGTNLFMKLSAGNLTQGIVFKSGSVKLVNVEPPMRIVVKTPFIEVEGHAEIDKTSFLYQSYRKYTLGHVVEMDGKVSFYIDYMDEEYMLLRFKNHDSYEIVRPYTMYYWEIGSLPSTEILSSWYHLALVVTLVIVVLAYCAHRFGFRMRIYRVS